MRLWPQGTHRRTGTWPDDRAARELAQSQASLARAETEVIEPLRELREKNNVTRLVTRLIREGGTRGHRPAAG